LLAEQTYCVPCSSCCHSLATVKHLEKVSILFAPLILYCVYFLHSYISVKYSKTKNVNLMWFEFINVYTLIKHFKKSYFSRYLLLEELEGLLSVIPIKY